VSQYYDGDAVSPNVNKYLTVVNSAAVKGYSYIGSEYGYVVQANVSQYYFGGGYYEADQ
jgi:hypothetical protein